MNTFKIKIIIIIVSSSNLKSLEDKWPEERDTFLQNILFAAVERKQWKKIWNIFNKINDDETQP